MTHPSLPPLAPPEAPAKPRKRWPHIALAVAAVAAMAASCAPAHAEQRLEFSIGATDHFEPGFNEDHWSLRYERGPRERYMLGSIYRNSEDRVSVVLGAGARWHNLFVEGGLTTGYDFAPIVPMARAGFEVGPLRVFAFPVVTEEAAHVGLGAELTLIKMEF